MVDAQASGACVRKDVRVRVSPWAPHPTLVRKKIKTRQASKPRSQPKYKHPIPGRDAIVAALEDKGIPLDRALLGEALGVPTAHLDSLQNRLRAMIRDGQLIQNRQQEFCVVRRIDLVTGRVSGHRDGHGWVRPDDGADDVYLSGRQMQALMHGDRVAVRIKGRDHRGRPEGRVVDILERGQREVVGRYVRERGVGYVVPDDGRISHHILIPAKRAAGAKTGQIVRAELSEFPSAKTHAMGRIVQVLGSEDAPGMEIEIVIHTHGLPHVWPEAVLEEAERFGPHVPAAAKRDRVDLRELPLVTIDGADARDFDDAVYCEPAGEEWRVLVAIADVSHYVKTGSAIDREARLRGTSVYFPNRVIPMLPKSLSNGLCSLNPRVDRLCLVCEMRVTAQGKVKSSSFYAGLMRSAGRLTYQQTETALSSGRIADKHRKLLPHLSNLKAVYEAFAIARRRRGAIDFDVPDVRMHFDDQGRIDRLEPYERKTSHRVIEECMIAANVEASRFLRKNRIPTLYRVHEGPQEDRLEELRLFLQTFGLKLSKSTGIEPRDIARLVRQVAGRPEAELVETVILRSLAQAQYRPRNIGHFGLSLPSYCHFTSPIRRYPDLMVHRAIHHILAHKRAAGFGFTMQDMEELGVRCSDAERRAELAARDAVDWLKCEFMQSRIGETFDGIVSGAKPFGLFVHLPELQVDGLVHIASLGHDYYRHDAVRHQLVGDKSGETFQLTDPVRVKVTGVDLDERNIDFALADRPVAERRQRRRRKD